MLFEKHFYLHLNKFFFKKPLPPILVACSGGVDSMVLLDLLRKYQTTTTAKLFVCHINHNQRKDAYKDEALVVNYCKKHQIDCETHRLDLPPGVSELKLRHHRYQVLEKIAKRKKAMIVTAHHAQDNLETYLFRLLRGAHPDTIQGIASQRQKNSIKIIRPLLNFEKKEILQYAISHQVPWREDSTNSSLKYTRNKIRHLLLPLLEELNPGSSQRMLRFFSLLNQRSQPATSIKKANRILMKKLTSKEGIFNQDLDFLELKETLDSLLKNHSQRTTQAHWEAVKRQLKQRGLNKSRAGEQKSLQFPGGYTLYFKGNKIFWLNHDRVKT